MAHLRTSSRSSLRRNTVRCLVAGLGLGIAGCGAGPLAAGGSQPARSSVGTSAVAPAPPLGAAALAGRAPQGEPAASATFEALSRAYQDLTYETLVATSKPRRAPEKTPSFDATAAEYYASIRRELQLSPEEQEIYRRTGVVGVDHGQRYSMASAYLAIYTHDLPVLITSDSVLHALHRSFDAILMELELERLLPEMQKVLTGVREALAAESAASRLPALEESARDVDLYLTVALRLLGGVKNNRFSSLFKQDDRVEAVLAAIAALGVDLDFSIYGGRRAVDWSQFRPRGHYLKSPTLSCYFRAMMWLGRADLGFALRPPAAANAHATDPGAERQRRDAALLSLLLARSGQLEPLAKIDRAIQFFVGASDSAGPADLALALGRAGVKETFELAPPAALDRVFAGLAGAGAGGQRIRSQTIDTDPNDAVPTPLPDVFQLFGQRFVLDSFVLSKVIYDSIVFHGQKQRRFMPAGLDVMAALGNDEAVALLRPELEQYQYAGNLMASREFIARQPPDTWNASVYNVWLSALSKLDDLPAGTSFPEVMRGHAWQAKQLQTQLASWAELRHDTILYAKQSYTSAILCEYPTGYVEPYPELFARLAVFADRSRGWLEAGGFSTPKMEGFLARFADIMHRLERLAQKELAAQPFDGEERKFVKDTISIEWRGGGCGRRATYSGWYRDLIYDGRPDSWEPTVADVHTDPNAGQVLEVGVGNVDFVVAAIDNAGSHAAYVGPIYSYYELRQPQPQRLTDKDWEHMIESDALPARPKWTHAFQGTMVRRLLTVH